MTIDIIKKFDALNRSNLKPVLVAKIKGLATETQHLKKLLRKNRNADSMSRLDSGKFFVSIDARHHLLAYAFLRGQTYSNVERTCARGNEPNAKRIFAVIEFTMLNRCSDSNGLNLDSVTKWLSRT